MDVAMISVREPVIAMARLRKQTAMAVLPVRSDHAGVTAERTRTQEGCGQDFVARWKERFVKERLAGLYARHRGKIVSENLK
jgi:hypothetical protein